MVVTCDIEFDKNLNDTFSPGQVINGTATLEIDKPQEINAIFLRIFGSARTSWSEKSFDKRRSFFGEEVYLDSKVYLLGSKNASKLNIAAGKHKFEFSFELPMKCPLSFNSFNGVIDYTLKVVLERPWKLDKTFTKKFNVLNELDLNSESPQLLNPVYAKAEKTLWVSLTRSEPFSLEVTMDAGGFVPEQNIPLAVLVNNESSVPVKEIKVALIMTINCYENLSTLHSATEIKTVGKQKCEGVLSHCKNIFNYELPVPATPPTFVNVCPIINISYEVHVEASFSGIHVSQVVCLPVTIGTVALDKGRKEKANQAMLPDMESNSKEMEGKGLDIERRTENGVEATESISTNIAPPTYEEVVNTCKPNDEKDK